MRADLGAIRERELREAARLLGVDRVDLLGFTDSGMSGDAGESTFVGAPFERVVAAVRAAVDAVRPDVLVTLDASDSHRDHVRIRDAAIEAARDAGVPRVYLACLPRSLMRRWVEHMRRERPEMEHLDADVAALGTPDADITTVHRSRRAPARPRTRHGRARLPDLPLRGPARRPAPGVPRRRPPAPDPSGPRSRPGRRPAGDLALRLTAPFRLQ